MDGLQKSESPLSSRLVDLQRSLATKDALQRMEFSRQRGGSRSAIGNTSWSLVKNNKASVNHTGWHKSRKSDSSGNA